MTKNIKLKLFYSIILRKEKNESPIDSEGFISMTRHQSDDYNDKAMQYIYMIENYRLSRSRQHLIYKMKSR